MSSGDPKVIAVASGKGGTGKTTVAAHLALLASRKRETLLVDLDVEAPDSLSYFPEAEAEGEKDTVSVPVPRAANDRCTGCLACVRTCRFGAVVVLGRVVSIGEALCKGCGACVSACPERVLEEREVEVGETRLFRTGSLRILEGRMSVGDIRSTAVIEAAKARSAIGSASLVVRDCPPGVSCPATHALEGADYAVLVAEPTEFSRHDLKAALDLVRGSGIKAGVIVNKDGFGDVDIDRLCDRYGVPVIGRIAYSRERAASGAAARLWRDDGRFMELVSEVLARALEEVEVPGAPVDGETSS